MEGCKNPPLSYESHNFKLISEINIILDILIFMIYQGNTIIISRQYN